MRRRDRDIRKAEAILNRPFEKRTPEAQPAPAACYVCGVELVSSTGRGTVQGGICGNCMGEASRKAADVRTNREVAARRKAASVAQRGNHDVTI